MLVAGNYCLFAPFISVLKWIPLIGWLLANIASVAVGIWSGLFGSILFMITLSLAWIFYRPLFGIALMVGIALLIFIMFHFGHGEQATSGA